MGCLFFFLRPLAHYPPQTYGVPFPLESAKAGEEIGFDLRVTLASQLDKPISWSDEANNQDTNTSKFGMLTLVDMP